MKKGTMRWVPSIVIEELEVIKREDGIESTADAMKKMVDDARKGRSLSQEISIINTKLPSILRIGEKKKRRGGLF